MYRQKAVIFDLDGTLLDTLEDLTDSVNAALRAYDCPEKTIDQIRMYVGNGIRNLMIRAVEGGESHPQFEDIFQAFKEHYKGNSQNKTKPYEGIMEVLRTLHTQGIKLAIVSNKADYAVKELNTYYFQEFSMTAIGEMENVRRKPAPDTVYQALKEINVSVEDAVFVGDSDVDMDTAKNAKIPCIGVLWGFRDKEVLKAHGAEHFAEKPEDILEVLMTI